MTKNKLRKAVSSVLGAWTNWSVYNSTFIDDLESKFEGREISSTIVNAAEELIQNDGDDLVAECTEVEHEPIAHDNDGAVSTTPRGTWTSGISVEGNETGDDFDGQVIVDLDGEEDDKKEIDDVDGDELDEDDIDGDVLDDIDGDELAEDDQQVIVSINDS